MALRILVMAVLAAFAEAAAAQEPPSSVFKLTTGRYSFSDDTAAWDVNLRNQSALGNAWVGYFHVDGGNVNQWRTGWDSSYGSAVRLSPSLQLASGGFAGGSVQVETGESWFAGAGFGRTNLRPYWNLNFDPNDSYMVSAGYRGAEERTVMLLLVRDNRQNPDQQHVHLFWRQRLPAGDRVSVDILRKTGTVDDQYIRRWGLTLTYDWPRYFVRVAYDPKTNFTAVDALRLSVGTRF